MSNENKIEDILAASKGLIEAVPIYQDLLQPAVKEIGRDLETVVKLVKIALAPISITVWGYEKIENFISNKVAYRLGKIPKENVITPKINVVGPALEALRFSGEENELANLYSKLIASSMNKDTATKAHPAFVEIIKQLSPDEARIVGQFIYLKPICLLDVRGEFISQQGHISHEGVTVLSNFSYIGREAGIEFLDLMPSYIDNICRLGLAEIPKDFVYGDIELYQILERDPIVQQKKFSIENMSSPQMRCVLTRKGLRITDLGKQFADICVPKEDEWFNKDVLRNFKKLAIEYPSVYLPHVAIKLTDLADLILDADRIKEAVDLYQDALSIQRGLPAAYSPNVALTLSRLGMAAIKSQECDEALAYLTEAEMLLKPFFERDSKRFDKLNNHIIELIALAATNRPYSE